MPAWTDEHRERITAAKAAAEAAMPYRCSACGKRRATWALMREHHDRCMEFRQSQIKKRLDAAGTARS